MTSFGIGRTVLAIGVLLIVAARTAHSALMDLDLIRVTVDENPSASFVAEALEDLRRRYSSLVHPWTTLTVGNYGGEILVVDDSDYSVFRIADDIFDNSPYSIVDGWAVRHWIEDHPELVGAFAIRNDEMLQLEAMVRTLLREGRLVNLDYSPVGPGSYVMHVGPFGRMMMPSAIWEVNVSTIPEPSLCTLVLSGMGVVMAFSVRRRFKRAAT